MMGSYISGYCYLHYVDKASQLLAFMQEITVSLSCSGTLALLPLLHHLLSPHQVTTIPDLFWQFYKCALAPRGQVS